MKKLSQERDSNFELLRIISMLFIVAFHTTCHGQALSNSENDILSIVLAFLVLISLVHVNSYVMVTGFYQSKSKFRQGKVWSLIGSSWFYRIVILIFLSALEIIKLTPIEIFEESFILNLTEYWFVKMYLVLYCLSPFINKLIDNIDQKKFKNLLIGCFIIFSVLPYITGNKAFSNDGFSLHHFIYLYLLGAYYRKYPITESYHFKRYSKTAQQLIFIGIFTSCVLLNFLVTENALNQLGKDPLLDLFSNNIIKGQLAYSNPIVIIQTIAYFSFFSALNIKSKFINKISNLTMGIYLIHDNQLVKSGFGLYKRLGIDNGPIYSSSFIFHLIGVILLIFIICAFIEWIRQLIFKFIYNRKVSLKIRNKYNEFINKLCTINNT